MGVLSCNRRGCSNIMCDRASHTYGYICNECFEELVDSGPNTDIENFMSSRKDDSTCNNESSYNKYNEEFPDQDHRWGT